MSDNEQQAYTIVDKTKVTVDQLLAEADEAWEDMRRPGTSAHAAAVRAGIDIEALPADLDEVLEIKPQGAGAISVDLLIVALGHMSWDVWKHVLLPQIRARWGDTALKAKEVAAKKAAAAAKKTTPKSK